MSKSHSPQFLQLVNNAKEQIDEMAPDELRERLKEGNIALIDVREDHEFASLHVEGARHLSKGVIERDIENQFPDTYSPLALYCGGGYRSALAAEQLQKMGYERVYSVEGGFRALRNAGFTLTQEDS